MIASNCRAITDFLRVVERRVKSADMVLGIDYSSSEPSAYLTEFFVDKPDKSIRDDFLTSPLIASISSPSS